MRHGDEGIAHVMIFVAILVITLLLCMSAIGGAQAPSSSSPASRVVRLRLSRPDRVLAARIAANEDSRPLRALGESGGTAGEPTADTLAILQVVADFASWRRVSHGTALRLLAPHVSGERPPTLRRHAVIGALPASGRATPAGWRLELDGDWRAHAAHWSHFRRRVEQLVEQGFEAPCARAVITWGNEGDTPIAESRGLVRVACGHTRNAIWGFPS